MSSVAYGTMRIARVRRNSAFRPGNENLAKVPTEQRHRQRQQDRETGYDRAVEEVLPQPRVVVEQRDVVAEADAVHLAGGGLRAHGSERAPHEREQEEDRQSAGEDVLRGPG
jgi:hypothetical protein